MRTRSNTRKGGPPNQPSLNGGMDIETDSRTKKDPNTVPLPPFNTDDDLRAYETRLDEEFS